MLRPLPSVEERVGRERSRSAPNTDRASHSPQHQDVPANVHHPGSFMRPARPMPPSQHSATPTKGHTYEHARQDSMLRAVPAAGTHLHAPTQPSPCSANASLNLCAPIPSMQVSDLQQCTQAKHCPVYLLDATYVLYTCRSFVQP